MSEEIGLFKVLGEEARKGNIRLGVAPKPVFDQEATFTCGCGFSKRVASMPVRAEPDGTPYVDNVCSGCEGHFPDSATLVCQGCHAAIARVKAGTAPSGFRYEKNRVYHADKCPACSPGCQNAHVMEQLDYETKHKS